MLDKYLFVFDRFPLVGVWFEFQIRLLSFKFYFHYKIVVFVKFVLGLSAPKRSQEEQNLQSIGKQSSRT